MIIKYQTLNSAGFVLFFVVEEEQTRNFDYIRRRAIDIVSKL